MRMIRYILAALCVLLAGFCAFGFLASFEPSDFAVFGKIGYPILGVVALLIAAWLVFKK